MALCTTVSPSANNDVVTSVQKRADNENPNRRIGNYCLPHSKLNNTVFMEIMRSTIHAKEQTIATVGKTDNRA